MQLATKIWLYIGALIIFYLVMNNEKSINNLFNAFINGTNSEIITLQGRTNTSVSFA